eukprot:SAG11_NODE_524_length_8751_cov_4.292765_8_plen_72_part_00
MRQCARDSCWSHPRGRVLLLPSARTSSSLLPAQMPPGPDRTQPTRLSLTRTSLLRKPIVVADSRTQTESLS